MPEMEKRVREIVQDPSRQIADSTIRVGSVSQLWDVIARVQNWATSENDKLELSGMQLSHAGWSVILHEIYSCTSFDNSLRVLHDINFRNLIFCRTTCCNSAAGTAPSCFEPVRLCHASIMHAASSPTFQRVPNARECGECMCRRRFRCATDFAFVNCWYMQF